MSLQADRLVAREWSCPGWEERKRGGKATHDGESVRSTSRAAAVGWPSASESLADDLEEETECGRDSSEVGPVVSSEPRESPGEYWSMSRCSRYVTSSGDLANRLAHTGRRRRLTSFSRSPAGNAEGQGNREAKLWITSVAVSGQIKPSASP